MFMLGEASGEVIVTMKHLREQYIETKRGLHIVFWT